MLCTPKPSLVLLIIIPFLNGYNWEYTLFSDKSICQSLKVVETEKENHDDE